MTSHLASSTMQLDGSWPPLLCCRAIAIGSRAHYSLSLSVSLSLYIYLLILEYVYRGRVYALRRQL